MVRLPGDMNDGRLMSVSMNTNGRHEGYICGDRRVLYFDYSGGYTNLHM